MFRPMGIPKKYMLFKSILSLYNQRQHSKYCNKLTIISTQQTIMKEFRILAFSDTHSMHQEIDIESLPPADFFIHSGDFTMKCQRQQLKSFRQFIQELPMKHKIVISGNHDFIFYPNNLKNHFTQPQTQQQLKSFTDVCHFLQFQMVEIDGLNILGINKGPEYFDWKFSFAKAQGEPIIEKYKGKVDILVTHWPPFEILDQVRKKENGGSKGLLEFVKAIRPNIHIFGHIHEKRGHLKQFGIQFYNASNATKHYDIITQPLQIVFSKQIDQLTKKNS